ncbi:MAG: hypothetical protein JWM38_2092, partial [Sphingomonas bacterium]|nr:hypothetical protein [Sphingomonas bacterium]
SAAAANFRAELALFLLRRGDEPG